MDTNFRDLLPVSIVVPVYNSALFLDKCIKSILDLEYPKERLEIIFIDNNSNDNSLNILKNYKDKILVLSESKKGPAAARNKGMQNAKNEIIAFTDSDCEVDKKWLINITKPLINNKNIAVGGRILSKMPCNNVEQYGELIHDHEKAINIYNPPYLITMNMAVRKSLFKSTGMYDEEFLRQSDSDFSYRAHQLGSKFKYAPDAIIFHRNVKTLTGLFKKGFIHGFWDVKFTKKHESSLFNSRRRIHLRAYIKIFMSLFYFLLFIIFNRKRAVFSLCYFTFNLGKRIGTICGSAKFKYLYI